MTRVDQQQDRVATGTLGSHRCGPADQDSLVAVAPTLGAIVESITDPYVMGDPVRDAAGRVVDFRVTAANRAATADVAPYPGILVGRLASELFPDQFGRRLIPVITEVLETGTPVSIDEYPYPSARAGGALRRYDVRASAIGDRLVFTWRDVTSRFDERSRFESTIANSADVVILVRGGVVDWVSPGVTDLLGWAPAEVAASPATSWSIRATGGGWTRPGRARSLASPPACACGT